MTYDIELPPTVQNIGFNLMGDADFTIPYTIDTILNSLAGNQLMTQDKENVCNIVINAVESITAKG